MNIRALLAYREEPHYCRECGQDFPIRDTNGSTPHAQVWMHTIRQHDSSARDYQSCSRNCVHRAQPEEIQADVRLYGKGISPPPKGPEYTEKLRKIWPEDE